MSARTIFTRHHIFILALSLVSFTAYAETLEEAWNEALTVNHNLKSVREMTAGSEQQLKAAESAYLPIVELEAGYRVLDNEPALKASLLGSSMEIPMADKESLSYKVMATLPIYTSGLISSGVDAASAGLKASRADEQSKILNLKLKIAEAFIGVLRAKQALQVATSHVTSLKVHVTDAQSMYEQGKVGRNDLLAAQVGLADARQQTSKAQNMLDLANSNYNYLLGRPLHQTVALNDIHSEVFRESLKVMTTKAISQRSELLAIANNVEALQHKATGVRATAGPQVALTGGYNYQQNQYQVFEDQWILGVGLKWKLFDGGMVRHQASAIDHQASGMKEQLKDLTYAISLQVRKAWLDVQESRNRVEVTKTAIDQANENYTVTRHRYERGLSRSSEVLDAETLRIQSQSNLANSRYDLLLASLRLKHSIGEL